MTTTWSYRTAALGGTFDVFHKGHEQFLSAAFKLSEKVLIGITSDRLITTLHKSHPVEPYSKRAQQVRQYLSRHNWSRRARIFPLRDPYGPAATRKNLDAIIVTSDTRGSARKLNRLRKSKGLSTLEVETVPLATAQDGKTISSTRIRKDVINRQGRIVSSEKRHGSN